VRRALLALALLLVALPLLAWLVLARQARRLGEALVTEASALEARAFTLASATGRGPVLECLARQCDVAPELDRGLPWTHPQVRAVIEGALPRDALDPALDLAARAADPWLARVVACGHLDRVAPTEGLGPFPDSLHGRRQSMPRLLEAAGTLGPLAVRAATQAGRADEALDTCGALLVQATALIRLEGFEALLPAMVASQALGPACRDAFAAGSATGRAHFERVARDVRALLPGFDEVLALERAQQGLRLFGAWVPNALDARLPPGARATTARRRAAPWERGLVPTLALRLSWRRFDAGLRAVEAAARLAPPAQRPALEAAERALSGAFLDRFLAAPMVDPQYHSYAGYLPALAANVDRVLSGPATATGVSP
jgi:hypothetical protein